jgi:hypothetical protein
MKNFKFPGLIKVQNIEELSDGSIKVFFDADDDFKKGFKKYYNLKKWSHKRFNLFVQDAIDNMVKKMKEENEQKNKKEKN